MQPYDILMVIVLVAATIFGAWKGMAWQLASLASLVLSYFIALQFSPQLAPMFGDSAPWNRFIAMLVIYIGTSLVVWLLFRVVAGFLDRVKLKEFDRQLGAMFGLAKGILLCVAITFFAVSLLPGEKKEAVLDSRSGHYIGIMLVKSHGVMPKELHEMLHPYLNKLEEKLVPDGPVNDHPSDEASAHSETEIVNGRDSTRGTDPFGNPISRGPIFRDPVETQSPFDDPLPTSIPGGRAAAPTERTATRPSSDQGASQIDIDWDSVRNSAVAAGAEELWRLATEPKESQQSQQP